MKITVRIKSVYGQPRVYPVCDLAKTLARLIGNKCLTKDQILLIKSLGFEVEVQRPEL